MGYLPVTHHSEAASWTPHLIYFQCPVTHIQFCSTHPYPSLSFFGYSPWQDCNEAISELVLRERERERNEWIGWPWNEVVAKQEDRQSQGTLLYQWILQPGTNGTLQLRSAFTLCRHSPTHIIVTLQGVAPAQCFNQKNAEQKKKHFKVKFFTCSSWTPRRWL